MKYFVTQKLSWNNINTFPHTSFWWEGLDGTKVLTHFPPTNTYTSMATSGDVIKSERDHKDVERSNCAMLLYGHGDGGGGPTYNMLLRLEAMEGAYGVPRLELASPIKFFRALENEADSLLKWRGELYLELHRGTCTSQARIKYYNRRCETILKEAEMLSFAYGIVSGDLVKLYPKSELELLWKDVLLNQFHDVLPGSSIAPVYDDAIRIYEQVEYSSVRIRDTAMNMLFGNRVGPTTIVNNLFKEEPLKGIVFFNTTPYEREEVLVVPWDGDASVSPQIGVIAVTGIKGFSMDTFTKSCVPLNDHTMVPVSISASKKGTGHFILENRFIRVHIDSCGHVTSLFDKEVGKDVIMGNSNRLMMYEDLPFYWDAWDVELYHLQKGRCVSETEEKVKLSIEMSGPLLASLLRVVQISPTSMVHQVISLSCLSKRLDFSCRIEWHESHQILKVEFPVMIRSEEASFECPFGMVKRPTHRDTSWDVARFEVCGHRFADLSEPGYGVALLNNCKYGYSVLDSVISLSLLRAPKMPDPECDQGTHVVKFALFPHCGDVVGGKVTEEAVKFNTELLWTSASSSLYDDRWLGKSVLQFYCAGKGVEFSNDMIPLSIETVKLAEDSSGDVIIRAYEPRGCRGVALLVAHKLLIVEKVKSCDFLENTTGNDLEGSPSTGYLVPYRPFQVISLRTSIRQNPDMTLFRESGSSVNMARVPSSSSFVNIPSPSKDSQ